MNNFELKPYTPRPGNLVNFELVEQSGKFMIGFYVHGKLLKPEMPDPLNVGGIYRHRSINGTKVQEKLPYYVPTNPQTEDQQANRTKFANAMAGWQALTDEQKAPYYKEAKRLHMLGHNLYIKRFMET